MLYFFWAAAVLVGFVLVDFRQALVGPYWMVVGPAGFVVSALLGWRHALRTGQVSVADGRRHLLHWGGMLVVDCAGHADAGPRHPAVGGV